MSGENFRKSYYEKVGCKVVEKKTLETLLTPPVDMTKLVNFSSRFTLPAVHRERVWSLLLGNPPGHRSFQKFV